jgi:predicted component of type VI protein secretion system
VIVKRAIGLFEPRLRDVKVQANVSGMTSGRPNLAISGLVSIDMKLMQLNFELQLDTKMSPLGKAE